MVHGDAIGLKLPPRVAPVQAVIVPIPGRVGARVAETVARAEALLAPVARVQTDRRDDRHTGREVPRVGAQGRADPGRDRPARRDAGQAVLVRRDTGEKRPVPLEGLAMAVEALLARSRRRCSSWRDAR